MEITKYLQRFVYGYPTGSITPTVLALSEELTPEDAVLWHGFVTLDPLPEMQTVGLFPATDGWVILSRAYGALYEDILLTGEDLLAMSGNIRWLIDLINEPLPIFHEAHQPIPPVSLPTMPTVTFDRRFLALNTLVSQEKCDLPFLLTVLAAALDSQGVMLRGFPGSALDRIDLVQGLMMLLPVPARPDFSFSTHVEQPKNARCRLIFSESSDTGGRWVVDYTTGIMPEFLRSPYINCLESLWQGDLKAFVAELRSMELMAAKLMPGISLKDGLNRVGERMLQDHRVLAGEPVPVENIREVLLNDPPPSGELREAYLARLLDHALNQRDAEAALIVTRWMDDDPSVDYALNVLMVEALLHQPDSVYFLVRTRLSQSIQERWLPRLHGAAVYSLQVAIQDSDTATLTNWLRLIAREPVSYQLADVLQQGILAAQESAHQDGELGFQLILFALKRAHSSVNMLLNDEALLNALPDKLYDALHDHEPAAVASLATIGREIFLLALGRSLEKHAAPVFTPDAITVFWSIYLENLPCAVPDPYLPSVILRGLLNGAIEWVNEAGLATLLTLILADKRDDLFTEVMGRVAARDISLLASALDASERGADDILRLVNQAVTGAALSQQQAVDVYRTILAKRNWVRATMPLVEQTARLYYQNPMLPFPREMAWQMLQVSTEARAEVAAKIVTKRLLAELEKTENEKTIAADLVRIFEQTAWSPMTRQLALNWWRDFVRYQPPQRLQQMDRVIAEKRSLEDLHDIAQTSLALRKLIGKKSLEDFADMVSTTFGFLKLISEAFDPNAKQQTLNFDPATVRTELDARAAELTPDEQRVLANNLKELGNLIATMAEHRSRASLMRREDEVDRQLAAGELMPQSAIDTLKWLSGYLDGMHKTGD